jgi:hypothetical protein
VAYFSFLPTFARDSISRRILERKLKLSYYTKRAGFK